MFPGKGGTEVFASYDSKAHGVLIGREMGSGSLQPKRRVARVDCCRISKGGGGVGGVGVGWVGWGVGVGGVGGG